MMTKLKNLAHKLFWLYIIGGFTTVALIGDTFAQNGGPTNTPPGWFWVNPDNTNGLTGIPGAGSDQGDSIVQVIRNFMNYALWFVSLIAFAMLLWGGYKMVASGWNEEAYKEGLKVLKNAAIGIAIIAISWMLVTFIFTAINWVTAV